MAIGLVDQLARHRSGGEMLGYWQQKPLPAENFVVSRMGDEVKRFLQHHRAHPPKAASLTPPSTTDPKTANRRPSRFLDSRAIGRTPTVPVALGDRIRSAGKLANPFRFNTP